jgi:hypothetical protein
MSQSSPSPSNCVIFEVFTAVTMKNALFWDVTPCGSCRNRRFGGTYCLHHQGDKNRLLVTANAGLCSPILVTLMIEAIRSSETSVLTRATRRNVQEDGILPVTVSNGGCTPSLCSRTVPVPQPQHLCTILHSTLNTQQPLLSYSTETQSQIRLRPTVSQSILMSGHLLGPVTSFSLDFSLDQCEFVIMGRSL